MPAPLENKVSPAEVTLLAKAAGLSIPDGRLRSIAVRLEALRSGAALVDALPLGEAEPAVVFRFAWRPD